MKSPESSCLVRNIKNNGAENLDNQPMIGNAYACEDCEVLALPKPLEQSGACRNGEHLKEIAREIGTFSWRSRQHS